VYTDTMHEMLGEGMLSRAELRLLAQVRSRFHITDAEHERVLQKLAVTDRRLLDPEAAGSIEERLQEKGYGIALRNLLLRGAKKADVERLRRDYGLSEEAHARVVADLTGRAGGMKEQIADLLTRIEELRAVHRTLRGFLLGPPFEFLSMVLLKRQDRLVDQVLDLFCVAGPKEVTLGSRGRLFDQNKITRRAAIETLAQVAEPALWQRLLPVLEARVPPPDLAAVTSEAEQERVLLALSRDPDPFLRAGAMQAWGSVVTPAERPQELERILCGLTDADPLVREAAQAVKDRAAAPPAPDGRPLRVSLPEIHPGDPFLAAMEHGFSSASMATPSAGFGSNDTAVTGRFAVPRLPTDLLPVSTHLDRMLFLHGVPLCVDFEPEDLLALSRTATDRTCPESESLFQQGQFSDEICVIVSGRAQVCIQTADGHKEVVTVLGPGDCIGEMSVIDGSPQSATVIAHHRPLRVLSIAGETFRRMLEDRPHVSLKVIDVLVGRLRLLIERAARGRGGT
jgi:CRP-like cAMP-binding protein